MKSWYSVSELVGLPGLPSTDRAIQIRAKRDHWKSQPRAGRGGGREYAFLSLPAETQDYLIRTSQTATALTVLPTGEETPTALVATGPAEPPTTQPQSAAAPTGERQRPLQPLTDLKDWQRRRMEARLALLMEVDRLAHVTGTERAVRTIVAQAEQGQLPPELQRLVPVANARSGHDGARTLSRRTLYRWLGEREQGHAALAPRPLERPTLPAWAPALLKLYRRPTKPSMASAMSELPKHLPEGVAAPSYWQASRFVRQLPRIQRERGRMGPRELRNLQPFRRRSTREHWPGDIYTMDGHTFDAEVQHPAHGRPFRPEITSCLDVATRKVVGWSVALSESGWAVLDALRHAAVSHGIPCILYVDNGSGYCNQLMDDVAVGVLARLGISKETSIPYNSQARGLIERLHRSLWVRLAKTLPTYMGDDMDAQAKQTVFKTTRRELREQGVSVLMLSWVQFERVASAAVADYNNRPHGGLPEIRDPETGRRRHQTPNEAWAEALSEGWESVNVDPGEADDLFRPYLVRKVSRGEISVFSNRYFSPALAEHHGEVVKAGFDIHDASRIWVRDRNDRFLCLAEFEGNQSSYFPVTAIEEAAAKRARGRLARAERRIDEIEAEHAGILGSLPAAAEATEGEKAAAAEMLARLQTPEALPATPLPANEGAPVAARPTFTTDFDLWLWMDAHPDAATSEDRLYLEQALAESPALSIQVEAELAKRARQSPADPA